MKRHRMLGIVALIVPMTVLLGRFARAQDQPPPAPSQEQPEVLNSGPVHEAFAEPATLQAQTGVVVPNQPPPNITEVPPAERPAGENFVWVPGYWNWDAVRNNFIWVSACWRAAPPGRYWVPGYWAQAAGGSGWEWIAGFWASASTQEAQEIEYLPAPPAPIDLEPSGAPPSSDSTWVPGCWYWRDGQYVRRPGYWLQQQTDWIWTPSHYRWTPRGYVFIDGHWDYALDRRGVLFAPVYFPPELYAQAGYSCSPTIAIDIDVLRDNLFIYPQYCHYYFGDYYDDAYVRIGIFPQFHGERNHTYYDPIYVHERWRYGHDDKRWEDNLRQVYDHRRADKDLRPARTYREMETRVAKLPEPERRKVELARPLEAMAASKTGPVKYEPLKAEDRTRFTRQATESNQFRDERVKWEAAGAAKPAAAKLPAET